MTMSRSQLHAQSTSVIGFFVILCLRFRVWLRRDLHRHIVLPIFFAFAAFWSGKSVIGLMICIWSTARWVLYKAEEAWGRSRSIAISSKKKKNRLEDEEVLHNAWECRRVSCRAVHQLLPQNRKVSGNRVSESINKETKQYVFLHHASFSSFLWTPQSRRSRDIEPSKPTLP